jgi:riboflavin biosynthesis pyrimidine reductase
MRDFQVLFETDKSAVAVDDPAFETYGGPLGFPPSPPARPFLFSNFVQSLDGIVSLRGKYSSGADISQSVEDRWLMDFLRAHADAVLLGAGTLLEDTRSGRFPRGPIYRIQDPRLRELRQKLGRKREMNIVVTGSASLNLSDFAVFDGDRVDTAIVTTHTGAARLAQRKTHPHVRILAAGGDSNIDMIAAVAAMRAELGIEYLLCEGGPTLYGSLARADLIDEKFVTVSPVEVGQFAPLPDGTVHSGNSPELRPTTFCVPGFGKEDATWWRWISCRRAGDHQFSRYRRIRQA